MDFNKRPMSLLGYIFCELEVGETYNRKARIFLTRPGEKSIVGRNWIYYLQFSIEPKTKDKVYNSMKIFSKEEVKQNRKRKEEMKVQFPNLFHRSGKIKHHKIHARFHEGAMVKKQKGSRVPIQQQESVKKEINRRLQEDHIVKLGDIKEDIFLQLTVITVKKDSSVKIALDARELNKKVVKDKYPMPNLDSLMDTMAEHVRRGPGKNFFSTLDKTYDYGQVELISDTSRQCIVQIIGGEATGIYGFATGFYGLTTMPTGMHRKMGLTHAGISKTF